MTILQWYNIAPSIAPFCHSCYLQYESTGDQVMPKHILNRRVSGNQVQTGYNCNQVCITSPCLFSRVRFSFDWERSYSIYGAGVMMNLCTYLHNCNMDSADSIFTMDYPTSTPMAASPAMLAPPTTDLNKFYYLTATVHSIYWQL